MNNVPLSEITEELDEESKMSSNVAVSYERSADECSANQIVLDVISSHSHGDVSTQSII